MAKKVFKMFIDEEDQESGVFAISLVENPAIESNWVYLAKHYKIELATANNDKQLLIGPVLIPNKQIPRIDQETGEEYDIVFDEDVIEKAAQLFLQRQYNNSSTLEHNAPLDDISFVESWIVADPKADKTNAYGLEYPKGTWVVMAKVNNQDIWSDYVKTGKVKGFSLEGLFGHNLVEASSQAHLVALSELNDIFDTEYAEEMLASIKGIIRKDGRMKEGKYLELETYNDYPDTVKNAAQRGIDLNAKVNNRCATEVGKIRAQQLANGRNISVQTIKRMYAYTSRAREFYNPDDTEACGTISYLLWGGDAANRWSAAKLKELGLFTENETAVSVSSSYSGQFGPAKTSKKPKKNNFVDTQNMEAQFIAGPTSEKDKKRFPGNKGTMFFPYLAPAMLEEGVPHYTIDGELYEGPTHEDEEGRLMTGAVHTEDSEYLYHKEDLDEYYSNYDEDEYDDEEYGDVELAGVKVGFDFNDTLTTQRGKELARQLVLEQYDVYIVTALNPSNRAVVERLAKEIGIDTDNIYFTNNQSKVPTINRLGLRRFYDNNADVIKEIKDALPMVDAIKLAEVGPRGGIKESPKAPKSDTPNPEPKGQGTAGGSASGKRGAEVSAQDEETLAKKAKEFNDKETNTKYGKAGLGVLKSVFQRGLGAYNTSRSPNVAAAGGAKQWALARVNAFLYLLKNGRPQNAKYTTDYDLLPKGHPKAE